MMPLQEEVDTQKGKYDDTKSDDRHYGRFSTSPAHCKSLMQKDGIKDPGDGGPYFFGIPAPESAPVGFGIYQAGNQSQGEHGKPNHNAGVTGRVQKLQRRQAFKKELMSFSFYRIFLNKK